MGGGGGRAGQNAGTREPPTTSPLVIGQLSFSYETTFSSVTTKGSRAGVGSTSTTRTPASPWPPVIASPRSSQRSHQRRAPFNPAPCTLHHHSTLHPAFSLTPWPPSCTSSRPALLPCRHTPLGPGHVSHDQPRTVSQHAASTYAPCPAPTHHVKRCPAPTPRPALLRRAQEPQLRAGGALHLSAFVDALSGEQARQVRIVRSETSGARCTARTRMATARPQHRTMHCIMH